jgi:hypothetical protein
VSACRPPEPSGDRASAEAPAPATVTAADLQRLRWIEGDWRGTGGGVPPFFERYRFLDDSTIASYTFTDSTRAQVADSGRIALSRGVLTSRGGTSAYVATEVGDGRVHFEPQENAANAFTWTRESDSSWTATLRWEDAEGVPQERAYRMERVGPVAGGE